MAISTQTKKWPQVPHKPTTPQTAGRGGQCAAAEVTPPPPHLATHAPAGRQVAAMRPPHIAAFVGCPLTPMAETEKGAE